MELPFSHIRTNLISVILLTGFFTFSALNSAAGNDNDIIIGEKVSFSSKILDEERTIQVYLPAGYSASSIEFPVMYLLDGRAHFHHATGITQFLTATGQIPGMIVIAVNNVDRSRDFSPTHVDNIPNSGGAEKFLDFFEKELIPFVERNYRTSTYRILVGHSFGGTFATYTLLSKPEIFKGYISISPYLQFDNGQLVSMTEKELKSKYDKTSFFMTLGDEPLYVETHNKFRELMKKKSPSGLTFTYTTYPGEDHSSVPHLSIYDGLKSIFSGWQVPKEVIQEGLSAIDQHYANLAKKFDYPVKTPEALINQLGYNYMNAGEIDNAINTFKTNVERFSHSANVYDSLGEAYEKNGQTEDALKNYKTAVELGNKNNDPNLAVYKTNLKRVEDLVMNN